MLVMFSILWEENNNFDSCTNEEKAGWKDKREGHKQDSKQQAERKAYTRKYIKNNVLELCELLEVKRKDLGIVVQAHAQMYFRSKLYDIDLDGVSSLADTGVIVLVVEKDMIATKLRPLS